MVITILAIGFVGIIIGTSVPHNPHPHAHAHQVHVAPPPVVHHRGSHTVVVKNKRPVVVNKHRPQKPPAKPNKRPNHRR